MNQPQRLSRRAILRRAAGIAAGAGLLAAARPLTVVRAQRALPDPYLGVIPLACPLAPGAYELPLNNNWHASREGERYPWNHRNGEDLRAHDGVDLYPLAGAPLPTVLAPLAGRVAAVGVRAENALAAPLRYLESDETPPPWDYSAAVDGVIELPLYGNFVWLVSNEPESAGFFVLLCHLQDDPLIEQLLPGQRLERGAPLGLMGDTGNAAGSPQLHLEIHYPIVQRFLCAHCAPLTPLTAIDPYASLLAAAR